MNHTLGAATTNGTSIAKSSDENTCRDAAFVGSGSGSGSGFSLSFSYSFSFSFSFSFSEVVGAKVESLPIWMQRPPLLEPIHVHMPSRLQRSFFRSDSQSNVACFVLQPFSWRRRVCTASEQPAAQPSSMVSRETQSVGIVVQPTRHWRRSHARSHVSASKVGASEGGADGAVDL